MVKRDLGRAVAASPTFMGKKSAARSGAEGSVLSYPATVAYKQWARAKYESLGWSQERLAEEMKRVAGVSVTDAALSQFFGKKNETPVPSNTTLMPAMNKALGIPPPPVCDPTDELAMIRDAFTERWNSLTAREQAAVLAMLGIERPKK